MESIKKHLSNVFCNTSLLADSVKINLKRVITSKKIRKEDKTCLEKKI